MNTFSRGSVLLLTLVFGAIFLSVLTALSSYVLIQNKVETARSAQNKASAIAEAGLDYYRWFLSHYPGDTQNGTGHAGPYTITYNDPEGGVAGTYTLNVVGNTVCGQTTSVEVTSTGVSVDSATFPKTLWARYAQPSIAQYSMIVGGSTWFSGTQFQGKMQSNGGLRMDGTTNNAPVTSSLSTWSCDPSFGCSPTQSKPGIFGTGQNQNLWSFPVPQMNFAGIAADFTSLKAAAIAGGIYLPRYSSNGKTHRGYHLIFNANGTVTVNKVDTVTALTGIVPVNGGDSTTDYTLINGETFYQTSTIPAQCGLIFVEDNTWIEGVVPSKVTLVAANVTNQGVSPDIVLPNNITYSAYDGSAGLTAIAAHNVLIGPNTPQDLTLDGIFVAQSGAFGRNMYKCDHPAYQYRNKLTMLGTIVSLLRQNNYWTGGCSSGQGGWSGYPDNLWTFVSDRQLSTNPPAFTPITSTQYKFVDWREQ